ncbi:PAS domain-containing protein [Halorarum halophilum]|uniref:histidine kinase n=1 Tax=Halorarum halophilum TaxID=2743090 RepID=A0A7D5KJY7_9EURY|nr:ATP-binding protein [Halobaculum halophilum]QLG26255.1 PAS domain-containing protein [Halobaculum halophilum]
MRSSSPPAELETRIRQQKVVAELGQQALETDDLDRLMHDAVAAVAETLDADYCKVLELLPGGDEVLLRQGVGWQDGLVGSATVPTDRDSQAGYTLLSEDPVIVDDLGTEERFSGPALLVDHDVVSGISVVVGSLEDPWGVLGVHTPEERAFSEYDANFVRSVANVLASAVENYRARNELKEIYGRISDAFFALDEEWNFAYLNERAHELINPGDRELVGSHVWDQFPAAIGRQFKSKYERAMYEQETVSFEEYYPEPLDAWFEVRAYPSETGLSVYFRDVTERKERERALERSEHRYRTLAEQFPNGIVTLFDEDLRYTLSAGRAFEDLPVSAEDVEGQPVAEVWGEEVAADLEPAMRAALAGEERAIEVAYAGREWIIHVVPVGDETGTVFGGMTMAQDITERNETQRRLEASNERLEQFAYAASHDLQEPLRMVSSYLQLIEHRYEDEFDEDGREFLEFAVDGADRMREMIDGLLRYSRIDTQGDSFEPVDLDDVFEHVREDLTVQVTGTDAEITTENLPRVEGDPDQLRQVLQNLLSNALEYSDEGPPRVHVSAERDSDEWIVSVRDEGIGVDPDDHERIFEVFERLHSRDDYPGAGIGLALCQRILERHDGEIWVDSEPGEGATFSFTLPTVDDR